MVKYCKGKKKILLAIDKSYITYQYQYHNELLMQYINIVYEDLTFFWSTK